MRTIPADTPERVKACQADGLTQFETAVKTGVSLSTVRKFWDTGSSRRNVSPEMIRDLQAQGKTQLEASEALGVSLSKVRMYWASNGRAGRPSGTESQMKGLIAQGKTDREIAEILGVAVSTVNRRRNAFKKAEEATRAAAGVQGVKDGQ